MEKIYYYNRITRESEWKKPKGFDGVDLKERSDNEYTRTFRTFEATPLEQPKPTGEGRIGKWEQVEPENDFFKVNAAKEEAENENSQRQLNKPSSKKPYIFNKFHIDKVPEGEIVGELHSDEEKYEWGDHDDNKNNPDSSSLFERKRNANTFEKQQEIIKEDTLMINQKDQLAIFRNKIDRGTIDEGYRKEAFKEKSDLSKIVGNVSSTFKKRTKANNNKRRKIADEDDDSDDY